MRTASAIIALVVLCMSASWGAAQDRVELKNGGAFSGEIVYQGKDWIVLKSGAATYTFTRDDIKRILHGGVRASRPGKSRIPRKRPGRKRRRPTGGSSLRAAETAIGQNASRIYGRLSAIRFDRHPGYTALRGTKAGTWAVYGIEGAPHDTERWVVVSVRHGRVLVKQTSFRQGRIVLETEKRFQLSDFGPQMPPALLRSSTLSKENVRTRLGTFASLRVSARDGTGSTAFADDAPISGIVDQRIGKLRRRLIQMGYRRRGVEKAKESAPTQPDPTPGAPVANPVADAYERARLGDFAVWRNPTTNRRWREVVTTRSESRLRITREIAKGAGYEQDGFRTYALEGRGRGYLERYRARPDGQETLRIGGHTYHCLRWRSASGGVRFWTSTKVVIGALVRQSMNGRVVRELVAIGRDPAQARR